MKNTHQPLTVLGGLTADEFMTQYWQRKPLLVRGALPNFTSPLTADELAGLSLEEEVESRLVIEQGNTPWELLHGPFDEQIFQQLPEKDWTLLVQAVDQFVPEIAALYEYFTFIPRWRFDDIMISYATPGGSVGPHYDNYDVFLIQSHGKRRWKIGPKENSESLTLEHPELRLLANFTQTDEWVLEPGDMLYLPPQFAHYGIAENECMTISVGLRAPSAQEVLINYTDFVSQFLSEETRYIDPDQPAVSKDLHAIDPHVITRLRKLIQTALDDDKKLLTWFGQQVTEPRYPDLIAGEDLSATELLDALQDGATLIKNPSARLAWSEYEQEAILFTNGYSRSFTSKYAPVLQIICEQESLNLSHLHTFLIDNQVTTLLLELLKQGTLGFANE